VEHTETTCDLSQGTSLQVSRLLEAHPTYSSWLDWTMKRGNIVPRFRDEVSNSMRKGSCFVRTGRKCGLCFEYRYCPELVMGPSTVKAGSTKTQRGYTAMGRRSASMN
jgi:hypothetical protein